MRSRLLACLAVLALGAPALAATPSGAPSLDARLRFLRLEHAAGKAPAEVPVTIRFAGPPTARQLAAARAAGATFHLAPDRPARGGPAPAGPGMDPDGVPGPSPAGPGMDPDGAPGPISARPGTLPGPDGAAILGGRTVVPATAGVDRLEALTAVEGVVRVETAWRPKRVPPLVDTRQLCRVEEAWQALDPDGALLDGSGVLLADIDTGVDVYHPDLWQGDGGEYAWLDVDGSGTFSDGDCVDVDGDGLPGADELLRWWPAPGSAPGDDPSFFQISVDHLYQDRDGDGVRDFGPPDFTESDPGFGEPLFRANDADGDDLLDPGETLTALSTSKVVAVYETDGTVRRRGVDLIHSQGDTYGHGTNVASILAGGAEGRRWAGLAPGAQLLFANLAYSAEPPFVTPLDVRMSWAAAEGAQIFVYEDGEWIWDFLDGSSNVEILMNELAAQGTIHVAAAGNLAAGGMHWEGDLGAAAGDSVVTFLDVTSPTSASVGVVWGDFYWIPEVDDEVLCEVVTPTGQRVPLGGAGSTTVAGNFQIYSATDLSPRGTRRVDFRIAPVDPVPTPLDGAWRFVLRRPVAGSSPLRLNAMSWDDLSSWFARARWREPWITGTVTWPGTADSSITVAAYSPQNLDINSFSGRGARVDGRSVVDLAAPGSTTWTGLRRESTGGVPGGYAAFGGTSAATPHVAGAAALLKQWDPSLGSGEMRRLLREGARSDAYTGAVPNETWGSGKLDVLGSILWSPTDAPAARRPGPVVLRPNVPNPFNPSTTLRYDLAREGETSVEIYDLRGRRVALLQRGLQPAGSHELVWRGVDDGGRPVATGIYLVRVVQGGFEAARKVTLLK